MKRQGTGRRVRVYIGESDQWRGKPLYAAIVQEARKRGMAGATVARGIMGFGAHSIVHETHLFSLSQDRPIVVEIVDSCNKIEDFLPVLDGMIKDGMITTSDVEVISYTAREQP